MKKLSSISQDLIERYQEWYRSLQQEETDFIHVDQQKSKVASFYNNVQENISWNQEHLFRKTVIYEILEKKLIHNKENKIAEFIIKELIKSGHLPNGKLPQPKIKEVQEIIDKYVFIIGHAPEKGERKTKKQLQNWLLSVTACEIEDALAPQKEKALTELMSNTISNKVEVSSEVKEKEKEIQAFIASQRTLFNADGSLLTYYLLLKKIPYWSDPSQEELIDITTGIFSIWKEIRRDLNNPLQEKFYKICKEFTPAFLIISDILEENLNSIERLKEPSWLEKKIKKTYKQKIKELKGKLFRMTTLSIIGFLAIRVILFFAVELTLIKTTLMWPFLLINFLAPILLLLLLTVVVTPPQTENLNIITLEIMNVFYGKEEDDNYQIDKSRGSTIKKLLLTFYHIFTFILFAGLIVFAFQQISLPLFSKVVFTAFIFLASFVIVKMKKRVQKIEATKPRSSLFYNVIKSLAYPIEIIENSITRRHKHYPLFLIILGSMIDVPFQAFLELINQWRYSLTRKS